MFFNVKSQSSIQRCLILIEDFDRDEDGMIGETGMSIRKQRYDQMNLTQM